MAIATASSSFEGQQNKEHTKIYKRNVNFTDGTPVDGITNQSLGGGSGVINDVRVLFGSPTPDTLTVVLKDTDGHTIVSGTITASGSVSMDKDIAYVGGLSLSLSGNTTEGAKALITIMSY